MKVAIVSFYFNFPIYKRFDHPAFYCRTGYVVLLIGFGLTEPSDAQVGIGFGLRTRT
jgi:hypothetical protein